VVHFAVVPGYVAARRRAAPILGVQDDPLARRGQPFAVVQSQGFALVEDGQVVVGLAAMRVTSDMGNTVASTGECLAGC